METSEVMDIRKSAISTLTLISIAMAGFSSSICAEGVSYNYAEVRYILDGETDDVDYDGFEIGGSYRVTNEFFAFGQYTDADLDDSKADFSLLTIGGGYIYPIDSTWESNFSLAFQKLDIDAGRHSDDDSGYLLSGGVRGMFNQNIELRASLNHNKLDESDTWITFGGDYFFTPNISAGAEFDLGGDTDAFSIGARYHF
jgi:predicted porin